LLHIPRYSEPQLARNVLVGTRIGHKWVLGDVKAYAVHVVGAEQGDPLLAVARDAEFRRLLHCVVRVITAVGDPDRVSAGLLCGDKHRREIPVVERCLGVARQFSAASLYDRGCVVFQRMTERVVGDDEEPALAALPDDGTPDSLRVAIGVGGQSTIVGVQFVLVIASAPGLLSKTILCRMSAMFITARAGDGQAASISVVTPSMSNHLVAIAAATFGLFWWSVAMNWIGSSSLPSKSR